MRYIIRLSCAGFYSMEYLYRFVDEREESKSLDSSEGAVGAKTSTPVLVVFPSGVDIVLSVLLMLLDTRVLLVNDISWLVLFVQ